MLNQVLKSITTPRIDLSELESVGHYVRKAALYVMFGGMYTTTLLLCTVYSASGFVYSLSKRMAAKLLSLATGKEVDSGGFPLYRKKQADKESVEVSQPDITSDHSDQNQLDQVDNHEQRSTVSDLEVTQSVLDSFEQVETTSPDDESTTGSEETSNEFEEYKAPTPPCTMHGTSAS